jgi:hypothetical protein
VLDDGHGMTYVDMMRMISFGHKQPNKHCEAQIGKFGIGFKVDISHFFVSLMVANDLFAIHCQCYKS